MKRTILSAVVATAAASTVAALIVTVDASHDRERAEKIRAAEACDRREAIVSAVTGIVDALIAAPPAMPRTPEQEAAFQQRAAAFRADVDERLEPLQPTDC